MRTHDVVTWVGVGDLLMGIEDGKFVVVGKGSSGSYSYCHGSYWTAGFVYI